MFYKIHPKLENKPYICGKKTKKIIQNICERELYHKGFVNDGKYDICKTNNTKGVLDLNGNWDPINRLNTNWSLQHYYMSCILHMDENYFDEFINNPYDDNIKILTAEKLFKFLNKNYDLFFTKKITDEYYNTAYIMLMDIWNKGNISVISSILTYKNFFGHKISSFIYDFKTGDLNDMNLGIDFEILYNDEKIEKFQVKTLKNITSTKNYVHFNISNGITRDYDKDINLCLTKIDNETDNVVCLSVKNKLHVNTDSFGKDLYSVKLKDILIMENYENKNIKLFYDVQKFCIENKISLDIIKNGDVDIKYDGNKLITIDFSDPMNNEKLDLLHDKFEKIKLTIHQQL